MERLTTVIPTMYPKMAMRSISTASCSIAILLVAWATLMATAIVAIFALASDMVPVGEGAAAELLAVQAPNGACG